jgi:O-antigen polymerase
MIKNTHRMVYLLVAVVAILVFSVDSSLYMSYHTTKLLLLLVAVPVILIVNCFYVWSKQRRLTFHISLIEILIALQILWGIAGNVSLVTHPSNNKMYFMISLLLLVFFVRQLYEEQIPLQEHQGNGTENTIPPLFLRSLWIMGFIQAIFGLVQYYNYLLSPPMNVIIIKSPMVGTIGTANGYGAFMAIAGMALITDLFQFDSLKSKVVLGLCGIVIVAALILNGCRGALLALLCSALFFILLASRRQLSKNVFSSSQIHEKKTIVHFSRKAIVLLCAGLVITGSISYVLFYRNVESSKGRMFVWNVSLPMLLEHPVQGVGVDRYAIEYLNYQRKFFDIDVNKAFAPKAANMKGSLNEYLQAFCESGFVGGILFLGMWGCALWFFLREQKKYSWEQIISSYSVASVLLVILLHSIVEIPLQVIPIAAIAFTCLGLVSLPPAYVRSFTITSKPSFGIVIVLLVSYSSFIGFRTVQQYHGFVHWQRGYEYGLREQWIPAIEEYETALNALPQNGELLVDLGTNLVMKKSYSKGVYVLKEAQQWFNDRNIYLSLSYAYLRMENYAEAERQAKIAASMFPDQLAPNILLGEIYYKQGRIKESKQVLRKCIRNETAIQSADVQQINWNARELWKQLYHQEITLPELVR